MSSTHLTQINAIITAVYVQICGHPYPFPVISIMDGSIFQLG